MQLVLGENMFSHSIIIIFVCILNLICIYYSLKIPWVRPIVPVSHGLYEISVPMEIGLLECFSDICHQYQELQHFLFRHQIILFKSEQPPGNSQSNPVNLTQSVNGLHLPKKIKVPTFITNPIQREKQSIEHFLIPYQTASITALICFSIVTLLSFFLILLIVYECLSHLYLLTNNLKNILLLANTFAFFLSVILYLLLTYPFLNGGMYVDGVWVISYASAIGLLCCIVGNLLDNSYERDRIHQSVDIYIQRHSPDRIPRSAGRGGNQSSVVNTHQNQLYYQYELVASQGDEENSGMLTESKEKTNLIYETPPRRKG